MAGIAAARLAQERKSWRRDHPFGFIARPTKNTDGSLNLFVWDCAIPGKKGTNWEGGLYRIKLHFSDEYPSKPPICRFDSPLFHPNLFFSGRVCLSILDENRHWKPSTSIEQILRGIQTLLDNPNLNSPAQYQPADLFIKDRQEYDRRIREEAKKNHVDIPNSRITATT